jgi:hypothetical protein
VPGSEALSGDSDAQSSTDPPIFRVAPLPKAFKLVFLSVLGITLIAFITHIWVALAVDEPSDSVKTLLGNCAMIYQSGIGAAVGLIGGKAT